MHNIIVFVKCLTNISVLPTDQAYQHIFQNFSFLYNGLYNIRPWSMNGKVKICTDFNFHKGKCETMFYINMLFGGINTLSFAKNNRSILLSNHHSSKPTKMSLLSAYTDRVLSLCTIRLEHCLLVRQYWEGNCSFIRRLFKCLLEKRKLTVFTVFLNSEWGWTGTSSKYEVGHIKHRTDITVWEPDNGGKEGRYITTYYYSKI